MGSGAGGILQIGGAVVGGMVGGPAGAMVGSQIGGAIGGAIDGDQTTKANPNAYKSQVDPAIAAKIKRDILSGEDPAAKQFAQDLIASNVASGQSMAAAGRGVNAGMAQRLAAQTTSQSNAEAINRANQLAATSANSKLQTYLGQAADNRNIAVQQDQMRVQQANAEQARKDQQMNQLFGGLAQAGGMYAAGMGQSEAPQLLPKDYQLGDLNNPAVGAQTSLGTGLSLSNNGQDYSFLNQYGYK
jgi:hypothetical protein